METLGWAHSRACMCDFVPVSERSTVSGGATVTVAMCVKRVRMKLLCAFGTSVKLHPNAEGALWAFFIFNHSSFWTAFRLCGDMADSYYGATDLT